ncbi:RNA-binding protein [Oribacterium sp. C9]|uniref:KH domain-containing protein n=1 Tax=Oribacterium sp. C9 TaxID=1943579 RepID=UPI00098F2646|nr:KH domain-containing protein [Oribacterium sp. C9]OON85467.1 RNA-binding protein [Oribacterium sp. C9]
MKELLETIARALVQNPDDVQVTEENRDGEIVLTLSVNEQDMGKVIGRSGRIAKAIRSVMSAAASKASVKVSVDIK